MNEINGMIAVASIATPDTDEQLREREHQKGYIARIQGYPRRANPWKGGMCSMWWEEGYDSFLPTTRIEAQ